MFQPSIYEQSPTTEPIITPETADIINSAVDLHFFFGPHNSTADAKPVKPLIAQADILVPEWGGWSEAAEQLANIVAASRENKRQFSPDQLTQAAQFEGIISQNLFLKTLLGKIKNSGKSVRFIDVNIDHPLIAKAAEAGDAYFWEKIIGSASSFPFHDALPRFTSNFTELSALTRDRELTIRHNLFNLLVDTANTQPDRSRNVLVTLGTAHHGTGDWLRNNGIHAEYHTNGSDSLFLLDPYTAAVQQAMNGKELSDTETARAMMGGIFIKTGKILAKQVRSSLRGPDVIRVLTHNVANVFTMEDMATVWDAPDEARIAVFTSIFESKGLTPQAIVDGYCNNLRQPAKVALGRNLSQNVYHSID